LCKNENEKKHKLIFNGTTKKLKINEYSWVFTGFHRTYIKKSLKNLRGRANYQLS